MKELVLTTLGKIRQQELLRDFTESGITIVERKNKQTETIELMFYCSPEVYLAENTTDKVCSVLLAEWEDKTQQQLNYAIEHPEHCILIDLGFVLSNPEEFLAFIKKMLDIELPSTPYATVENTQLAMQCAQLVDCDSKQECYEDIMAAADLFDEQSEQAVLERLKSYLLATELESGKLKVERDEAKTQVKSKTKELEGENELALLQIHQLQEELESAFVSVNKLTTENTELTEKKQVLALESEKLKVERDTTKAQVESKTKELEGENELALLQIHQLQEELESLFVSVNKLTTENTGLKQALELESGKLKAEKDKATTQVKFKIEELECENELALLQIHQLQEELEFYYMKAQGVSLVKLNNQANINLNEIKSSLQLLKLLENQQYNVC